MKVKKAQRPPYTLGIAATCRAAAEAEVAKRKRLDRSGAARAEKLETLRTTLGVLPMRPKRKAPDRPGSLDPSSSDGEFAGEARVAEVAPLLPPPEESLLKSPAAVANSESYLASLPLAPCAGVPSANCTSSVLAAASVAALGSTAASPRSWTQHLVARISRTMRMKREFL